LDGLGNGVVVVIFFLSFSFFWVASVFFGRRGRFRDLHVTVLLFLEMTIGVSRDDIPNSNPNSILKAQNADNIHLSFFPLPSVDGHILNPNKPTAGTGSGPASKGKILVPAHSTNADLQGVDGG